MSGEVPVDQQGFRVSALDHAPGFVAIKSEAELRVAGPADVAFKLLDSGRGFLALTAFRCSVSLKENVEAFRAVPKRLRMRLGKRAAGYWLVAHWKDMARRLAPETSSSGDPEFADGVEYLWLIPQPEGVECGEWLDAAVFLAKEGGQDAFVIRCAQGGQAEVRGADGRVWATLASSAEIMFALGVLARLRATAGAFDREFVRDLLQRHSAAGTAESGGVVMALQEVILSMATADSIGTHWLFQHIDALPGPRL